MRPQFHSLLKQPYTRRTLMAAVLSSSMLPAARADYEAEVLSENPVVYYRFDDAVTVDDLDTAVGVNLGSLGVSGDGSFIGTTTRGVPGAITGNTAMSAIQPNATATNFVGAMNVPNIAALNPSHTGTNPFTVECWVKPNTNTSPLLSPFNSMSFTTGRAGYLIYQNGATWQLRIGNKASTTPVLTLNGGTVVAGTWQHIAFTYSGGATGTAILYVDGVPVATGVPTGTGYEANDNAPFLIGATSNLARTFDGTVDEVAFTAAVLDEARIDARIAERNTNPAGYQAHVLADSPVGYWRLNEPAFVPRTPPAAVNAGSLGASANGSYYAGSKNASGGPSPSSGFLGFGATNSSLGLATANGHVGTPYSLNSLTSYTVMGWVKRGAIKSTRGGYFGQNDKLEFGDAGGGTQIEAWSGGGQVLTSYSAADDEWVFITYVADGSNNRLYINGVQAASVAGGVGGSSAFNFNVGGGGVFNATGDYFRGEIDEVAVFDKAVTPGRVKQLYDAALGNVTPGLVDAFPSVTPLGEIPEGQPYTLSIDPTGTPPFTYQWKLNGVDIPLATGKTYTVAAAAANSPNPLDPFAYTVVVTNGSGTVTSSATDVYVTPTLKWTSTDPTNPGKWDISTLAPAALNWAKFTGGAPSAYTDDYAVLFDDTATATAVVLTQDLVPKGVIFNNSTKNYTTSGPYLISSPIGGGVVKNGTGTVEIGNDILNVDKVTVNDGVLRIGNGTTGAMTAITVATVTGGELQIHHASGTPFESATSVTGGLLSFGGAGDFSTSQTANITGSGSELFEGTGTIVVAGPNLVGGTVTIDSGTVVFDGNQQANRLAAGKVVTVNPGAVMEIRGVNALPTGLNSVSPILNQATLKVVTGGSVGVGATGESHAHMGNLLLDGSSIVFSYSGAGGVYNGESFQLNGNITVTGSAASTISNDGSVNNGSSGIAPSSDTPTTHTVTVADVAAGPDLTITTELENSGSPTPANATLAKEGPGTLRLAGGFAHSFSGTTQVNAGTLEATGSVAGPLVIGSSGTIAPGASAGTFGAGATTLSGSYACEIDGAVGDKLAVTGNLTFGPGAQIAISVLGGGVTAPFYELISCSGTVSGPLPSVTGIPVGYSITQQSNSIVLVQNGFSFSPSFVAVPGSVSTALDAEDFNATDGGFTVTPVISAETDWTYSAGSWRANGQASAFGSDNSSFLVSPPFTLTKSGVVTLSFAHRHSFEADFDGGAVDVSLNDGPWVRVSTVSFSQNPYNGTLGNVDHMLRNGPAFVGNSAGHPSFITSVCKLTAGDVGDTVKIRFISATDNNTVGDLTPVGWEIDELSLTEGGPGGATLNWPLGIMQYSDTLDAPWTDISGSGPVFIDTTLAPKRFFRLKP
jgi:autotransporter-associated beta strand protein